MALHTCVHTSFVYSLLAQALYRSMVRQEGDNAKCTVTLSAITVKDVHQCLSTAAYSPLLLALNASPEDMTHADHGLLTRNWGRTRV